MIWTRVSFFDWEDFSPQRTDSVVDKLRLEKEMIRPVLVLNRIPELLQLTTEDPLAINWLWSYHAGLA